MPVLANVLLSVMPVPRHARFEALSIDVRNESRAPSRSPVDRGVSERVPEKQQPSLRGRRRKQPANVQ
jgi:hypothetical protein